MLLIYNSVVTLFISFIGWMLVWHKLGYYATKKLALREFQVTLTEDQLAIRSSDSEKEQWVQLSQIASYSYLESDNGRHFSVRLHSGAKVVFDHSNTFCAADDLQALATKFEARVHQSSSPVATDGGFTNIKIPMAGIQREKTFFETPLGNVAGWLILVVLVYFSWYLLTYGPNKEKSVVVPFLIYGNGLAYLWRWWDARKTRNS
jgi:hypothetical protein